jgi:hypothetical protein
MLKSKDRKKTLQGEEKSKEQSYERKAMEMARAHWVTQTKKAIKERLYQPGD